MKLVLLVLSLASISALAFLGGCRTTGGGSEMMKPPFGGTEDMQRAGNLWSRMSGYRSWPSYPDLGGFQDGQSPHGKFLKYHINSAASNNHRNPGAGSIIVKENYMSASPSALGAITVMEKVPGYDPENGDWFWVKFAPDGSVMKNPKGMSLAGRVAKGMEQGCIACHANADGGDFLFINDV